MASSRVKPGNEKIIQALSGSGIQVVLEFPRTDYTGSYYLVAPDILTVSFSVARTKNPVFNIGDVTMSGMSLGTKLIAGSIIKLFHRTDSLSTYLKIVKASSNSPEMFMDDQSKIQSNVSFKEISDYMRDDITPFNIHFIATVETLLDNEYYNYTNSGVSNSDDPLSDTLAPRVTSIIGATIINNGNVFSIENLITEETINFIARTIIFDSDNLKANPANSRWVKGSTLIGMRG